jgi:peroxiredoxin Q/BCP
MNTGDVVADFELPDETGTPRRLSEFLAKGPVVLFFRDLKAEFEGLGAQRLGISADTVAKQKQFSDTHSFDYPLLSDTERTVARQFGVKRGLNVLPNKRATFVIGTDSKVVAVINSEVNMAKHADSALEILRQRTP